MIIVETVTINNRQFTKTYSDSGFMVERDGVQYSEAIDPIDANRVYTETDKTIDSEFTQATEQDYQNALAEMGVVFND